MCVCVCVRVCVCARARACLCVCVQTWKFLRRLKSYVEGGALLCSSSYHIVCLCVNFTPAGARC